MSGIGSTVSRLLCCLLLGAGGLQAAEPRPNMIVIFCDNLGYGDIEPFGSTVHRTPALNRMAEEGRRFTHFCVSSGVCTPSRASLMTGCYAQRVGMHHNPRDGRVLRPLSPYGLHPDEITIAEVLKDRGYATGIFGKWHLGDQPEFLPTRQGFDRFFGIPYSDDMTRAVGQRISPRLQGELWPELPLMEEERVVEAPVDRNELTRRCTQQVLQFIDQHQHESFFVYFAQPMPGSTTAPFASETFRGRSSNGPWGDAVEEIDWSTGQILDRLRQLNLDRQTLVVWLSDNGAPLNRDPESVARGSNRPLHGRGYTTSEGAFRTPTLMWWPDQIPGGTECHELATTMDLLPTCALLAGQAIDYPVDGHDIRPLLLGEPSAPSPWDQFYYYEGQQLQAVRQGRWKLFLPLKTFQQHPHFAAGEGDDPLLFDVVTDIACTHNVATEHPDRVAEMLRLAEDAKRDLGDLDQSGIGQRPAGHLTQRPPQALVP